MSFWKKLHLLVYNLLKTRAGVGPRMRHVPSPQVIALELANLGNEKYDTADLEILSHASAAEYNLRQCLEEQKTLFGQLIADDDLEGVSERLQPLRDMQQRLLDAVSVLDTESHKVSLQYLMWKMRENYIKQLLLDWMNKQGHEQCWYYPEIFKEIARTLEVKPTQEMNLPPREEFRKGCCRFEDEIY